MNEGECCGTFKYTYNIWYLILLCASLAIFRYLISLTSHDHLPRILSGLIHCEKLWKLSSAVDCDGQRDSLRVYDIVYIVLQNSDLEIVGPYNSKQIPLKILLSLHHSPL